MTKQLLEVVCSISSLKRIFLQNCRLKKLPVGFVAYHAYMCVFMNMCEIFNVIAALWIILYL